MIEPNRRWCQSQTETMETSEGHHRNVNVLEIAEWVTECITTMRKESNPADPSEVRYAGAFQCHYVLSMFWASLSLWVVWTSLTTCFSQLPVQLSSVQSSFVGSGALWRLGPQFDVSLFLHLCLRGLTGDLWVPEHGASQKGKGHGWHFPIAAAKTWESLMLKFQYGMRCWETTSQQFWTASFSHNIHNPTGKSSKAMAMEKTWENREFVLRKCSSASPSSSYLLISAEICA